MWLRVRGLPWRPAAAVIATVSMMLAAVMGSHFAGMRAQAVEPVQTTTIPHTKITGDGNYFTFADNAWEPGNDVHTWSKVPSGQPPGGGHLVYGPILRQRNRRLCRQEQAHGQGEILY